MLEKGMRIVIQGETYKVESDKGDLVRALTLVSGLKKIRHIPFYEFVLNFIHKSSKDISLKNIVTILETLCYNKIASTLRESNKILPELLVEVKDRLTINDIEIFPNAANLAVYFYKNSDKVQLYLSLKKPAKLVIRGIHELLFTALQ